MKFKYRAEIDGLRAIAVLPVIFFHAGFNIFSGGFIGVDVFFVISGYLITSILLNQLGNNNFSLKYFYERRARRIIPVLICVILITSILAFVLLTRTELYTYFKSVNATLLFYSNFYFWKTTPYFRSESDLEPLLHTWSLSIEEQFYIIFPIILFIFYKFFRKYIFILFVFFFFISLFLCQIFSLKTGGTLNFYFTLSRAWELALGGICAYLIFYKEIYLPNILKNLLSLIGLALILFSIFFFDRSTVYPSFYTLVPTLGTALIILYANERSFVKKILSIKIFVGIGLISFSLYLWHQPLLAFGRIFFENFSNEKKLISLLVSFFLSIISYNFIEKIFRNNKKISKKFFFTTFFLSIILLITFSQLSINFFSTKNSTETLLAKALVNEEAVYFTKMDDRQFVKNRILVETLDVKNLIIGSSRIMKISNKNFNQQVLNLGVSGASIQDHIAITEMALEKFNPNKIFLGADPWLFNKYNNQLRWNSISDEYKISLKNILSMNKNNKVLKNVNLNESYNFYERSLENLYNFINIRKLSLEQTENNINNSTKDIILRDGSRVSGKKKIKKKINTTVIEYSMDKYEFSEEYYRIYKKFIEYLVNIHNKEVILVLSPYYLPSYKSTIQAKPFYLDLEKKFKELGKITNAQIIGSYDASVIGCKENEFYDSMHPKDSCIMKITKQIK
tara:strand:+ start:12 stop:2051 length:2040 start_codon:yes stop_codon:yes gene_type:complete